MADPFFDGGQLPPNFNRASGIDPGPELKAPDDPELNYDPPEPSPPGLGAGPATTINHVAKEELDGPSRDAIQQAQDRMDRGETEMGDPMLTPEFNRAGWSSQEIEETQKEDQAAGLDCEAEPDWDEQARREYELWELEAMKERYYERWGEEGDIEDYERFGSSKERSYGSDGADEQEQWFAEVMRKQAEFMREQNAEIESDPNFSPEQGPEHDRGIEH